MRAAGKTLWGASRVAMLFVAAAAACALVDRPLRALADEPATELAQRDGERLFIETIEPLLRSRCASCHNGDLAEGGLRLDSRDALIAGGDSGPAVTLGDPQQSLLIMAVAGTHAALEMPPQEKLDSEQVAALVRWIEAGAPWPAKPQADAGTSVAGDGVPIGDAWSDPRNPITQLWGGQRLDLWSLRPVVRPNVLQAEGESWAKGDLDRLIVARMEQDGVEPPPAADARTIARRLYFDLTGLPPTPEQAAAFARRVETAGADEAIAALVDELLASPRFGEHFGRMWLDVVRYSDSNGFDWDEFRPQAWRFRDYVVRSFNADKPFDEFIREQLAGDELVDGPPKCRDEQDRLIATGFLRLGPHDNAAALFDEQDRSRAELLADVTETTASAFLGLTFSCCRCHDHKYDPVSQADHYRLRAFFAAVKFADDLPLDLADEQAAIADHNARVDAEVQPLRDKVEALAEDDAEARKELETEIAEVEAKRRSFTTGLSMTDDPANVPKMHVLFQGDHKAPREAVEPGFPSVFDPQPASIAASGGGRTTGRRLTLANWIASPDNPLTARVLVNRVWQHLMGRALVPTANDFGLAGAAPESPETLDWLADEFVAGGWSVKRLVRIIATSGVYRQAATFDRQHVGLRTPRRLSAEQLRDAVLCTSGLLTEKAGGPPVWPDLPPDILNSNPAFLDDNPQRTKGWYPSPKAEQYCRSLFLVQKRNTRAPMLELFDLPDNSTPCARRETSTTAPQGLMLMNNALTIDAARAMAARIEREVGTDADRQIVRVFELALQRPPAESELLACRRLLAARSLPELCRAALNVNEFVYLD
jgi:mono/diheme cytochrome c family protein